MDNEVSQPKCAGNFTGCGIRRSSRSLLPLVMFPLNDEMCLSSPPLTTLRPSKVSALTQAFLTPTGGRCDRISAWNFSLPTLRALTMPLLRPQATKEPSGLTPRLRMGEDVSSLAGRRSTPLTFSSMSILPFSPLRRFMAGSSALCLRALLLLLTSYSGLIPPLRMSQKHRLPEEPPETNWLPSCMNFTLVDCEADAARSATRPDVLMSQMPIPPSS
mmetsp:Transcript_6056/g.14047  ORF Transcript_6056/g.14047 Transcript_6056/m.14047 type:complete len:217 (+) Transcript_6056:214-864(+)